MIRIMNLRKRKSVKVIETIGKPDEFDSENTEEKKPLMKILRKKPFKAQ